MSYSPTPPPRPALFEKLRVLEVKCADGESFDADLATMAREEEYEYLDEFNQFRVAWLRITEENIGMQRFSRGLTFANNGFIDSMFLADAAEPCFDLNLIINGVAADNMEVSSDLDLEGFEMVEASDPLAGTYDRRLVIPRPLGNLTLYVASQV